MDDANGRHNRERNGSARDERAARRGATAATAGEGGNDGGNEAAAGAAAAVAPSDVVPPGTALDAGAGENVSLSDSEFDELDREPDPTAVVDEALRTPAPAPPPLPTPAHLPPPPPRTAATTPHLSTPNLLPPTRRVLAPTDSSAQSAAPTSTTPAPAGGARSLSEADRARRDQKAEKIEAALFSAK